MDTTNQIVTSVLQSVLVTPETTQKPLIFSDSERDSIAYFFMRLNNVYGAEYRRQLPDPESEKLSKREWGGDLKRYNRDQIDAGIEWIKTQQENFNDGWEFMGLGRCVGAIREANRHRAAHQPRIAIEQTPLTKDERKFSMAQLRDKVGI